MDIVDELREEASFAHKVTGCSIKRHTATRAANEIKRLQAECEKLRLALRRTVLTYVVDDCAWDREAEADRVMQYAMTSNVYVEN